MSGTGYKDNPDCRLDDLIKDAAHRFCTTEVVSEQFHYLNLLCYLSQMGKYRISVLGIRYLLNMEMLEHTRDMLADNEQFLHHLKKLSDVHITLSTRELFYLSVQISFLFLTGTHKLPFSFRSFFMKFGRSLICQFTLMATSIRSGRRVHVERSRLLRGQSPLRH
jgi:hypothetical protein